MLWDKQGYKVEQIRSNGLATDPYALRKKIDNFASNPDKYSAPVASVGNHYCVFIGYDENGDYLVLNPAKDNVITSLSIDTKIYTQIQFVR